jgi:hypothetical protein
MDDETGERDCISCYSPTRKRVILIGSAEWFAYACERLEIPNKEAVALLTLLAEEHAPYGGGKTYRTGKHRFPSRGHYMLALCPACALKAGMTVGEGSHLPAYSEPPADS